MKTFFRIVSQISYIVGLLSLILAFFLRMVPSLHARFNYAPHGALVFAGVLFLCSLASLAMTRAEAS